MADSTEPGRRISSQDEATLMGFFKGELANPTPRQFYDFATWEFSVQKQNIFAALVSAVEGERLVAETPNQLNTFDDLLFCDDLDFNKTFRFTRKTVHALVTDLKRAEYTGTEDVSTQKSVLMTLWCLGGCGDWEEAAKVFSIGRGAPAVQEIVLSICNAIVTLPGILKWPSKEESIDTERNLHRRFGFPKLIGVLGCFTFVMKDSGVVAVEVVVDDDLKFRHIHTVPDSTTPPLVLMSSPLFEKVQYKREDGNNILAGSMYPQCGCLLTPYTNDGTLSEEELQFNTVHSRTMTLLRDSFSLLMARFTALRNLDIQPYRAEHIIEAACCLHNYSLFHHDMAEIP